MKGSSRGRSQITLAFASCLSLLMAATFEPSSTTAGIVEEPLFLNFETELKELNLTGGPFPLPLASDPGNSLGDSIEGYGFVDSQVAVQLSSQRLANPGQPSLGQACAFSGLAAATADGEGLGVTGSFCPPDPPPITPQDIQDLDGQAFFVDSFFDVFFDITVTDVDPRAGRDYAGQPDGASIQLPDTGPAQVFSSYTRIFDEGAPNFGLIPPPEESPYIGHVQIEIPLGGDINGNGENDKIKFTLVTHSVGGENRTFIQLPDGTVIDEFDSGGLIEGLVVDESTDPPFTVGAIRADGLPDPSVFGGRTTASSRLLNPQIPEPSTGILAALASIGFFVARQFGPRLRRGIQ